jgi:ribonuclease HII
MLRPRYKEDTLIEAGIDEAGRGCLWGPLIAAAVIWLPEAEWTEEHRLISEQIKDSKKLSPKKRAYLRKAIENLAVDFSIGRVEAIEIDTLGMTAANKMAFQRAIQHLTVEPDRVVIDGTLELDTLTEQIVEPGADGKYIAVAAASILAKEAHDDIIAGFCMIDETLDANYGLLKCKGYGTKKHCEGILKHGKEHQHRRLFLRKLLGEEHVCTNIIETYAFIEDP